MKKGIICFFVCMLMIVSTIVPVSGTTFSDKTSKPLTMGSILYVGGSGPNNYTKIQDAIDNSSEGDTVFVFNDSSPYVENIVITTSIALIGEDKDTTIIDGANNSDSVNISADNVTITRFTIQNGNDSGILINSNNNRIIDNILSDNFCGVSSTKFFSVPLWTADNIITNNLITRNGAGIWFVNSSNNTIRGNIISQSEIGIILMTAANNNISFNVISENVEGVWIMISYNTMIYRNNVSYNRNFGVSTLQTSADKILQNNFIRNNLSALSSQWFLGKIRMFKNFNFPIRRNIWNGNYWDEPRLLPYKIPGVLKIKFQVDWHPAQEPYDI